MDLLCTENIMHEYETEILCHQQKQQLLPQKSNLIIESNEYSTERQTNLSINDNSYNNTTTTITTTSPQSLYSSSSSLLSSATSCSSTNSSGYNSSSSTSSNISSSSSSLSSSNNPLTSSTSSNTSSASSTNNCCHPAKLQCDEDSNEFVDNLCLNNNNEATTTSSADIQLQQQQQQNNVYVNNLINRSLDYVNTATEDPTFLTDRCLENALKAEEKRPQPICTYFKTVQKDITPPMRKIVAEWMMEVCAEEKCQEEVVLLALNYMDRFLSTKTVRKTHLQILAAACLLLASKLREPSCRALSAELLVFYTDNSIHKADLIPSICRRHFVETSQLISGLGKFLKFRNSLEQNQNHNEFQSMYTDELISINETSAAYIRLKKTENLNKKWELFVLSRLGWDLSCVTPLDFLELLLIRLPIRSSKFPDLDLDKVRQHAQAFISLAAKEHHFSMYSASTVAASSIAAALSGLNWHLRTGQNLRYLLNLLTDLTSVEQDFLHDCMMKMETIFEEHSRNLQPYLGNVEIQHHNSLNNNTNSNSNNNSTSNNNSNNNNNSSNSISTTTLTAAQSQFIQNNPQYLHYAYHNHHNHHHQQQQPQQQHHLHHHHHSGPAMHQHQHQHHHHHHHLDIVSAAGSLNANNLLPNLTQTCKMQVNAQKEVQDIKF